MSYYLNRKVFFGGALVLYQRNLATAVPKSKTHRSPSWYMQFNLGGTKIDRSTKRTSYEDAYQFAQDEFLRSKHAVRHGHSLDEYTFEEHWDDWHKRNVGAGTWKIERQEWHKNYANRYFKEYFRHPDGRSMLLNEIDKTVANQYWNWRVQYWSTVAAARVLKSNPKRRGAKTKSTRNAKVTPSKKTLAMEQSALNQIFWDARELGRMQHQFKLKAPRDQNPHNRRPHFEEAEYKSLVSYLKSYRDQIGHFKDDKLNAWHKIQRTQLYHFVLFMTNSGLRVGEAREMRWRDIKFDQSVEGSDDVIAVVDVRKNTKKGQHRDVQVQPNGNLTLKQWHRKTPHKKPNDLVWFGQGESDEGPKPFTNLNKSFQNFLSRIPKTGLKRGLLFNKEGDRRTLYSLRHTYATFRIHKGDVNYNDLALNMGCLRSQLERHYSHATSNTRRSEIVKTKTKFKIGRQANESSPSDAFILEATKRYQAGKIDGDAFLKIIDASRLEGRGAEANNEAIKTPST